MRGLPGWRSHSSGPRADKARKRIASIVPQRVHPHDALLVPSFARTPRGAVDHPSSPSSGPRPCSSARPLRPARAEAASAPRAPPEEAAPAVTSPRPSSPRAAISLIAPRPEYKDFEPASPRWARRPTSAACASASAATSARARAMPIPRPRSASPGRPTRTPASEVTWAADPSKWPATNRASGITWATPEGTLNSNGDQRMHEVYLGLAPQPRDDLLLPRRRRPGGRRAAGARCSASAPPRTTPRPRCASA